MTAAAPEITADNAAGSPAIGFRVARETYGLRLADVRELIAVPRITRVPNSPVHIAGVINLHGNVVPVFDLAARFGIGRTTIGPDARVVVVEARGEPIGILAEYVTRVIRFTDDEIRVAPATATEIQAEFVEGVVRVDDRFIILLDLAATFEGSITETQGDEDVGS